MNHHHPSGRARAMARLGVLARGLLALAALAVLLVGVPLVLARTAGWPLPAAWPTAAGTRLAVRGGLSDAFWLKAFAVVVWLAWVQLAFAVAAEVAALVRGRTPRSRLGLSWAQDLAAHLVGTVVMLTSIIGQAPHVGASGPPVSVQAVAIASPPAGLLVADPPPLVPGAHVVVRGESLSSIARDELGTQAAWPQIWEANKGRSYGTRVFEDPNLILPGWDLAVPGAAMPPTAATPPPVEPVLIPPLILRASEAPAAAPSTTELASPATETAMAPASTARDEPPTTADLAPLTTAAGSQVATASQDDAPAWARLVTLLGATLLATGTAGMVASSRRRALRAATVGSAVVPPGPPLADAVTALAAGSDHLAMARLELALRALAGRLDRMGSEARPVAVRRRDDALDVALDRPAELGDPWVGDADSSCWSLPGTVSLVELTADARAVAPPCPALVGLGRDDQGAEVYLDLEAVGTLSIASGPSASSSLRLLVATLAVTPLADGLRVLLVGADLPELRGRHDVRTVPDVATAVAEVEALTASIAPVTGGARSTFRLRAMAGHESWEPVVVVVPGLAASPDDLGRLSRLAGADRGVAVIGIDLADAGCQLAVEPDGHVRVGPSSWPVRPYGLAEEELVAIGAVLTAADGLVIEAVPVAGAVGSDAPAALASPNGTGPRPWSLMVRVLGPIDVVDGGGRQATFERAKSLELVVWLAQHAASATRGGARAALWEADVSNASFSNIVSEARRSLARLMPPPDGEDWLARTYVERLPLNPSVVLDADLVADHLSRARSLPDAEAILELRQALGFVRGAPYADRSYLWPDAEALPSTLTLLVTTVAAELGRRLLALDDADGVFAATAVGLEVLPGHEELIALRLHAHALKGDRAALRNEYASYEQAVLADPWDGEPAPRLVALRRELLGPQQPVPVAGD